MRHLKHCAALKKPVHCLNTFLTLAYESYEVCNVTLGGLSSILSCCVDIKKGDTRKCDWRNAKRKVTQTSWEMRGNPAKADAFPKRTRNNPHHAKLSGHVKNMQSSLAAWNLLEVFGQ